jgi:hypothetical protein
MEIDPNLVKAADSVAPGLGGALIAATLKDGTFYLRLSFFVVGAIAAYFASDLAAKIGEFSASTSAFLVGALSPAVINKFLNSWDEFNLTSVLSRWLPGSGKEEK